jgi:hypothetical protein
MFCCWLPFYFIDRVLCEHRQRAVVNPRGSSRKVLSQPLASPIAISAALNFAGVYRPDPIRSLRATEMYHVCFSSRPDLSGAHRTGPAIREYMFRLGLGEPFMNFHTHDLNIDFRGKLVAGTAVALPQILTTAEYLWDVVGRPMHLQFDAHAIETGQMQTVIANKCRPHAHTIGTCMHAHKYITPQPHTHTSHARTLPHDCTDLERKCY